MKSIFKTLTFFITWSYVTVAVAANQIQTPPFLKTVTTDDLNKAGDEAYKWLFVIFLLSIALSSIRPGFSFLNGDSDEGIKRSKEILIGALVGLLLGGIVFAIIQSIG